MLLPHSGNYDDTRCLADDRHPLWFKYGLAEIFSSFQAESSDAGLHQQAADLLKQIRP